MKGSIYTFILVILMITSCQKERPSCFERKGNETSLKLNYQSFNAISINDNLNVEVKKGPYSISLTGPENILKGISHEVVDETLILNNNNKCLFVKGYNYETYLTISMPNLDSVYYNGYGEFNLSHSDSLSDFIFDNWGSGGEINLNLNYRSVTIKSHVGSATLTALGNAIFSEFYSDSFGWINASQLTSEFAIVSQNGDGDILCYASQSITGEVTSFGNVKVKGNPNVKEVEITGKGLLIAE